MSTLDRPKVDAILPLTFIQNALLFHSLSTNDDQGFIHVKLDLLGELDKDALQQCWNQLVARHDVFRSSLHWEKIKSPVQVVHKNADHIWSNIDLQSVAQKEQQEHIASFLAEDRAQGFNLNKASISRVTVFTLAPKVHRLIWSCHHLLLDGWSSANVIRELSELYKARSGSEPSALLPIPSLKEYRRDLKQNDLEAAKNYWIEYLDGFSDPTLVSKMQKPTTSEQGFDTKKFTLEGKVFTDLESYTKKNKLTITSVLQMAWSIVLAGIGNTNDVAFGNIVSVRSPRLKHSELMCGLFTNMLPVRVQIEYSDTPHMLGEKIQKSQSNIRDYTYASLDDLLKWKRWPGYQPLFDHIFVVENFPWKDVDQGDIVFSNFRSGITSTYPLTVVAKVNEMLNLDFIFDKSKLSEDLVDLLGQNMITVLQSITTESKLSIEDLIKQQIKVKESQTEVKNEDDILDRSQNFEIDQPTTPTELALTSIWENLFIRDGIGVNDNFFDLGGKSLLAVRLFQKIQKELNVNAPPIMILQYPTISKLAAYISGDKADLQWKSLVPLRVKGDKKPLFCLHAKGGYVFFYNKFTSYLENDQPVYALQPRGLNGEDALYNSIEEMASHYIEEIKTIQPEGPYFIMATCFSNAVGLEMAQQFKAQNDEVGCLLMVDAAPGKSTQQSLKEKKILDRANYIIKSSSVYKKSKNLVSQLIKPNNSKKEEEEDVADKHENHLVGLFDKYERKPYDGKITLVRSTEFDGMKRKDFHLEDWKGLVADENIEVLTVEGHHKTLFLEPEVQNLSQSINQRLSQMHNVSVHKQ